VNINIFFAKTNVKTQKMHDKTFKKRAEDTILLDNPQGKES
jgi:hypothetical protein